MTRTRTRRGRIGAVAVAPLVAVALVGATAGRTGEGWLASAIDASPVAASPVASPAASPVASRPASVPAQSVSVAGSVTIRMTDQGFVPRYVESTNGHDLTITLVNSGTRPHGFRIDHYDIGVLLQPGATETVVIHHPDLGDYTFFSDAPGDGGMEGTLTFYI